MQLLRVESKCPRQDLCYIKNVVPYFSPRNFVFVRMLSVSIYNRRDSGHNVKLQTERLLSVVLHEISARNVSMVHLICHLRKEDSFLKIFQKAPYITKLFIFLGRMPQ